MNNLSYEKMGLKSRFVNTFPIFNFSLLHAVHKKYNWGLLLAMFLPSILIFVLLISINQSLNGGQIWLWYYRIYFQMGLFFLTSLSALIIGTGIYRDEISDETIVYVMTKPIDRQRIFIERLFAYYVISITIVTPGIIAGHIAGDLATRLYDDQFSLSLFNSIYNLTFELLAVYILLIGLGSVFVATGLWLKRPMLINLILAFGVILEGFFLDLISNQFEPVYIAQNMVAREVRGFETIDPVNIPFEHNIAFDLQTFYLPNNVGTMDGIFNFLVILVLTVLMGLKIAKSKQFN